jgi:capsid protein
MDFKKWYEEYQLNNWKRAQEIKATWLWEQDIEIDPNKAANARKTELETKMTSLHREYAKQGRDFEEEKQYLEEEAKWLSTLQGKEKSIENIGPSV